MRSAFNDEVRLYSCELPLVIERRSQMTRVESEALLRRITGEIWSARRVHLVDELIAEDLIDHVEMPGLEGTGRARYLASVGLVHNGFSDYHEEIELVVADEDRAVSYVA